MLYAYVNLFTMATRHSGCVMLTTMTMMTRHSGLIGTAQLPSAAGAATTCLCCCFIGYHVQLLQCVMNGNAQNQAELSAT